MKKLYSVVLTLVLCITLLASTAAAAKSEGAYSAIATNNAIVVSNSTDAPDAHLVHPAVYKIDGYNYFKLRDVAILLNSSEKQFAVDYDDNAKAVSITSGKPYTAVGGELSGTAAASCSAIVSNNTLIINGNSTDLTVFKIDGYNYFKLRDLGKALDFYVGYDDETKTAYISGRKGYETTENIGNYTNSPDGNARTIREDVCELYLEVLEDLWNVDPGLNDGISQIGIDLSKLSHLTEVEKEIVMHEFASKHNLPYIAGTWEELCEQGYIDKDNLYWEDGLFFSIKTNEDAVWNIPAMKEGDPLPELTAFDAQKWRSGLGAYYFGQCTAQKNADGKWSYTVGQEAIS